MSDIVLTSFEATSFKGIDASRPVLLDLAKKDGKNVTLLSGDQGTRKSSTIEALMYSLGANFEFDKDNLVNLTDGTLKVDNEFYADEDGEQIKYRVNATKSRFLLERFYGTKKDGKWVKEDDPKTTLRRLVGHLGVSPMFLKEKNGKEQIEWFRKQFSDEENSKKEMSLLKKLADLIPKRRDVNREYKRLETILKANDLFNSWEASQREFAEAVTVDKEQERLASLQDDVNRYDKAVNKLESIKENIADTEKKIRDLRMELDVEEQKLAVHQESKTKGEEFIAENATVKRDYEEARAAFSKINERMLRQKEWEEVKQQKEQMDEMETAIQDADATKDKLKLELLKVTKKYLPEIAGLEMKIASGIDKEEQDEGIYYQGKTLAQLSESELWGLFLQIFEQKGVRFVFVENVTSLGSKAVDILNMLAQNGVKIFATAMDRKKESMKILISDKL